MVELIVAALAAWQIVEIWHHSILMADLRAITELWANRLGDLLACPWCLSVWVGFACVFLPELPGGVGSFFALLVQAFAVSRLANLGNDVFHGYCRTPRFVLPPGEADVRDPADTTNQVAL